jgi:hypothetical protein
MLYMVTFTINIPQMLAYIPYMDPMGFMGIGSVTAPLCLRGAFIPDESPSAPPMPLWTF